MALEATGEGATTRSAIPTIYSLYGKRPQQTGASSTQASTTASDDNQSTVEAMVAALDDTKPENHMTLAVFSCLLCACPCGLLSLFHAVQVDSNYYEGNRAEAIYYSRQAWRWAMISVGLGCLMVLIALMYFLVLLSIRVHK